jgi:hypothetical protein
VAEAKKEPTASESLFLSLLGTAENDIKSDEKWV